MSVADVVAMMTPTPDLTDEQCHEIEAQVVDKPLNITTRADALQYARGMIRAGYRAAAEESEKLRAALKEVIDAGDEAVSGEHDDLSTMLRYGQAIDAARVLTGEKE